jgi:hypothetical protein
MNQVFVEADVRFLVVGAYALALHAKPRATGDLDLWVEPDPQNAGRRQSGIPPVNFCRKTPVQFSPGRPGICSSNYEGW